MSSVKPGTACPSVDRANVSLRASRATTLAVAVLLASAIMLVLACADRGNPAPTTAQSLPSGSPSSPGAATPATLSAQSAAPVPDGAAVFAANCSVCHSLPILGSLFEQNRGRPPGFVYDALTAGNMRRMGSPLDEASRRAVAEFFTGVRFDSPAAERNFEVSPRCAPEQARFDWRDLAYPSWGRTPRNLRALPDGEGISRDAVSKLAVAWVIAFPESSQLRSQATAAGGALFVGSHNGSVYALDQATGCTRWRFKAATEVRSAVTIDVEAGPVVRAVFGDRAANVYALDAETGAQLWKQSVDPHLNAAITGSITAHAGKLFVPISSNDDINSMDPSYPCCTHSGAVVALDARTGAILWRTPTIGEPPGSTGRTAIGTEIRGPSGASIWNTPTLDEQRGLLFVGTGNNHSRPATAMSDSILALELETGRVVWTYQAQAQDAWNAACSFGTRSSCPDPEGPDTDFGGTTMLVDVGGRDLLFAGQKAGILHALDPATGRLVWKKTIVRGGPQGGIRYGMASDGGVLFVPAMVEGNEDGEGREALPGLHALRAKDGALVWQTNGAELCAERSPCVGIVGAPPLATSEVVFAAGIDGVVYALDRRSGDVLWQLDTTMELTTLLGGTTRGGGIQGTAGPLVAGGRLFVSSGYGQAQRPGNALIALAPREERAAVSAESK
ncbi:PQQ-binding-like beta-propeller repeat protein [Myxococcota bacterium]|nr:PQQ-binding-like beta-propeller repeat protein [Myxococcota bacterium]